MPAASKNKNGSFKYLWLIIFLVNCLTILFLFFSVLAWYISPEKTNFFAYMGLAFPFILCVNLAFLFLWLILRKWKYCIVAFAPILICISPILTYFPIHTGGNIPKDCIKILSYNVKAFDWNKGLKDSDKNPAIRYIRDSKADLVFLQEYASLNKTPKAGARSIEATLKDYPYTSVINLRPSLKNYTYGLACFSKYPIVSVRQIRFEDTINGAVLYEINVDGKIISVINVHLESNKLTTDDKKLYRELFKEGNRQLFDEVTDNIRTRLGTAYTTRAQQADLIAGIIDKLENENIIVCGDFNDTPISYTYKKVKGNLSDAYAETGFGAGVTYNENYFLFRIDFIMHSKNMKAYDCTVDKVKYSDHYPVSAYLKFN